MVVYPTFNMADNHFTTVHYFTTLVTVLSTFT